MESIAMTSLQNAKKLCPQITSITENLSYGSGLKARTYMKIGYAEG
jgi:hypothetical protein